MALLNFASKCFTIIFSPSVVIGPIITSIQSSLLSFKGISIYVKLTGVFATIEGPKAFMKLYNLKSASNLNDNLNCSKELEHYAS